MPGKKTTSAALLQTAKRLVAKPRIPRIQIEEAYRRSHKRFARILRHRLRVPDDCEDALHDAVEKLLVCEVTEPIVDLDAYWFVVASHVASDRNQRRAADPADNSELEDILELRAQHQRSMEENYMSNDIFHRLQEQLTPAEREAMRLVKWEGLKHREAAAVMNVTERRIETLLATAKAKLRALDSSGLDHTSGERK